VFSIDKTTFSLLDFDPIDLNEYLRHEIEKNIIIPSTISYNQKCTFDVTLRVLESVMKLTSTSSINQDVISNETPIFFDFEMGVPTTSPTCSRNQTLMLELEELQSKQPVDIISIFSKQLIEMQSTSTEPNYTEVVPRLKTTQYGEVITT
jgi:hypothetical protein